ncbi:MAG: hypothetical protein ABGW84_06960 [Sphingomonadaceae bacterium]
MQNKGGVSERTAEQEGPEQNQADTGEDEAISQLSPVGPLIPEGTKAETQIAEQRAEADLEAQQEMAFWAMLMFFATLATVAITAFGVFLVKRTLDETIKAVKETSEATEAMRETNTIAKLSNERQLRAYVNIEEAVLQSHPAVGESLRIWVKIRNFGSTPAYDFSILSASGWRERPNQQPKDMMDQPHPLSKGIIGPGAPITQAVDLPPFDNATLENLMAGRIILFITGSINYRDAFGKKRITRFAYEVDARPGRIGLVPSLEGNTAT